MIQTANPIQDLLQAVYSCISDFNGSYAQITKAPREEWASMMDEAFGSLLSHHMEILRCSKIVADATHTHLYHPLVPETFTMAINTAADLHLKAMRNEVFRVMSEQLVTRNEHDHLDAYATSTYSFGEDELRELSYLIPGQNGWVHVCPNSKLEGFLNAHRGEQFLVELQVTDSSPIQYGVYKASIMPGQAMSGLEFAELSQSTRNNVAKSLCHFENGEEEDSPAKLREVMEDLLHSRIVLACIFLECIQGPLSPNALVESLHIQDTEDLSKPAYLNEDALLPTRDSVPGYFAPRLMHAAFSDSENEVEEVDDILLDFSSIGSRRWNVRERRGSSPPPFGVIGDLRRPARLFATSTPNVSDGVDDDDDYYEDDEDEDEDENPSPSDGARTPVAVSFSYTTSEPQQETSSCFSESELLYGGALNISEPLRPIHLNGRVSRDHFMRLNSSFPGLPSRKSESVSDSAESSFTKNKSESHANLNYNTATTTTDIADEDISKDFSYLKVVEEENASFLRPSSALASIMSGQRHHGSTFDSSDDRSSSSSSIPPDSPIWNTCRLRKMTSAPAIPRPSRGNVENAAVNLDWKLNKSTAGVTLTRRRRQMSSRNSSYGYTVSGDGTSSSADSLEEEGEGLKLFW